MRIGSIDAAQNTSAAIAEIVPIGVFEKPDVWALRTDHTAAPKLKASGIMEIPANVFT